MGLTVAYQEEMMKYGPNKQSEGYFVTQIARADLVEGTPVCAWPGHFSNSELLLRYGIAFPNTPVGIGRNVTQPPNWTPRKDAPIMKEYEKYNCSNLEGFEMRFNPKGRPTGNFVRCYRVSWFMANGWYSPMIFDRLHLLDKWPPPKRYKHEDWLSWTQADLEVNKVMREYCTQMMTALDEQDFDVLDSLSKSS